MQTDPAIESSSLNVDPRRNRNAPKPWGGAILPVGAGLLLLAIWQLQGFHLLFGLRTYQLPLPSAIAAAISANAELLLHYTSYTVTEAVLGLLVGSALGYLVAVAATVWPRWGAGGLLIVASFNAVPIVALAPIMNLWFGDGIGSRVAIVAVTTMAAMAINAYKGLNAIDPHVLDALKSYAATKWQAFRYVRFASSLPYVFTGLKINTTAGMIGAIVGEFFVSSRGLGYLLSNSIKVAKMPLGWACIVAAAIAGILLYFTAERLEKRFLAWHSSQRV
ncbi:ABC transporter permease [Paenibacillus sp. TRM 82003]|nr:ABC transporter permease [Paenibacillus sp. TRM 82003]